MPGTTQNLGGKSMLNCRKFNFRLNDNLSGCGDQTPRPAPLHPWEA